jgi:phosphoribosylanthranilate isomerase
MFRIKICGITNVDDALAMVGAGADALGLNFYARSPRFVSAEVARDIVRAIPAEIVKVGVFVNSPASDACALFDELGLDLIQLHGDESPAFLQNFGYRPVMRAFRVGSEGIGPVMEYLRRCAELHVRPALTLLDSSLPGAYGGTGKTGSWKAAHQYSEQPNVPPLVLAGGLTLDNVALAILAVRAAAIDVASGVESRPGRKDPIAAAAFVRAARQALDYTQRLT